MFMWLIRLFVCYVQIGEQKTLCIRKISLSHSEFAILFRSFLSSFPFPPVIVDISVVILPISVCIHSHTHAHTKIGCCPKPNASVVCVFYDWKCCSWIIRPNCLECNADKIKNDNLACLFVFSDSFAIDMYLQFGNNCLIECIQKRFSA